MPFGNISHHQPGPLSYPSFAGHHRKCRGGVQGYFPMSGTLSQSGKMIVSKLRSMLTLLYPIPHAAISLVVQCIQRIHE